MQCHRSVGRMAACGLAVLGAAGVAEARAADYSGTWASNPRQCRTGQDRQNAPLVLTRTRYDQHEAHCSFASVRQIGTGVWRVDARCSVEGDRQRQSMTLTVRGDRLIVQDGQGERRLIRCR